MSGSHASLPIEHAASFGAQLFESSPDCMKLLDADGILVAMNRNGRLAMDIGDFTSVAGKPWISLFPEMSRAAVGAAVERARAGATGEAVVFCPTLGGKPKWWDIAISRLDGADGKLVAVSRDVTEQRQTRLEREHLLREMQAANDRMNDVFKHAPAFMCILRGPDHVFEMANDRYYQLVGQRPIVGLPIREALPEVLGQGLFELLDRVYESGETFVGNNLHVKLQREPGAPLEERYVDVIYTALRDAGGRIYGLLSHGIDQTHRRLAEIALHESRERFQKIVSQAATGVVEMDVAGRITLVNQKFCQMLGYAEEELLGAWIVDITAPESVPTTLEALARVVAEGSGQVVDKHYRRKDGSLQPATSSLNALRNAAGESHGLVAIVLDTTESRRAEEQLRRFAADLEEADRRKTDFLATLAHELRNPLAPIRSGLGVMRLSRDATPAMVRVREMMERQVSHMVHLIDDLLDVARISGGKLNLRKSRAGLAAILGSAVETSLPLVEAARHELSVEVPDEELFVDADATRIAQVVANLLNNAAKYTPPGGRIALALRREGLDALIEVTDTGVGIPPHALQSVFEMFSQVATDSERSQGGLGIGLSLVRQLVQMHGGSVVAESAGPGRGSRFTVRLPLLMEDADVQASAAEEPPLADSAAGVRVLVVDDNVDAAVSLSMLLEVEAYATRVAHSGPDAVALAGEFRPAVVFLDIGMPGMNGYQTAEAIRRLPGIAQPCLVALTGWGAEHDRARSAAAGFDHHLTKPVELATVQALLAQVAASRV